MASPEDAFAFPKRKLVRAGLPIFQRFVRQSCLLI